MRRTSVAIMLAAACVLFVSSGCKSITTDLFENGTYTGSAGQQLVINGDDFAYTFTGITFEGTYAITGSSVKFTTTKIDGTVTGLKQSTTFDFVSTANSITLTNQRDIVNGGCGMAPDTFTK